MESTLIAGLFTSGISHLPSDHWRVIRRCQHQQEAWKALLLLNIIIIISISITIIINIIIIIWGEPNNESLIYHKKTYFVEIPWIFQFFPSALTVGKQIWTSLISWANIGLSWASSIFTLAVKHNFCSKLKVDSIHHFIHGNGTKRNATVVEESHVAIVDDQVPRLVGFVWNWTFTLEFRVLFWWQSSFGLVTNLWSFNRRG